MKITDAGIDAYSGLQFVLVSELRGATSAISKHEEFREWIYINCKSYVSISPLVHDWPETLYHCTFGFTDHNEAMLFRLTF